MQFITMMRELMLGLGIALIIPGIVHYTALILYPRPAFPTTYYDTQSNEAKVQEMAVYKQQRAIPDMVYLCVALSVSIISLIVGTFIASPALGMGFILAGLICLAQGFVMYIGDLSAYFKLGILLLVLLLLFGLSVRVSRNR